MASGANSSLDCVECEPGTFCYTTGQAFPGPPCPADFWCAGGVFEATPCPAGTYTEGEGATSEGECHEPLPSSVEANLVAIAVCALGAVGILSCVGRALWRRRGQAST